MPRIVRTARGEQIDFDTIIIKQALAQAPMNIEVARRKEFIDSKEGKVRGAKKPEELVALPEVTDLVPEAAISSEAEFEAVEAPVKKSSRVAEPVPDLPKR